MVADPVRDLALLKVDVPSGLRLKPLAVGREPLPDEEVSAFGYPMGDTLIVTRGVVSGLTSANHLVLDCTVNPGNSGGPLCNQFGEVAGMVSAKALATQTLESYGLAISANDLREFLADSLGRVSLPSGSYARKRSLSERKRSLSEMTSMVGPGVVMITSK